MKIHELKRGSRHNRYCGPAAISFLTGCNTSEAARLIRDVTGRTSIKGTGDWAMRQALLRCDVHPHNLLVRGEPTLAKWLRQTVKIRTSGRVFLVSAGRHWQLVTGRRYACGRIGEIVSIKDKQVKRRSRVKDVWELSTLNKPTFPKELKDETQKRITYGRNARRAKARRLAKKIGADIDINSDGREGIVDVELWVWPPDSFYDEDGEPKRDEDGERLGGWDCCDVHVRSWKECIESLELFEKILKEHHNHEK